MTAPGTLLVSKMLVPETEQPKTAGRVVMSEARAKKENRKKICSAPLPGARDDGLHMALNIGAMLIAFLALMALLDGIFGGFTTMFPGFPQAWKAILGAALRSGGMGDWRSLARLRGHRKLCWARAWC